MIVNNVLCDGGGLFMLTRAWRLRNWVRKVMLEAIALSFKLSSGGRQEDG